MYLYGDPTMHNAKQSPDPNKLVFESLDDPEHGFVFSLIPRNLPTFAGDNEWKLNLLASTALNPLGDSKLEEEIRAVPPGCVV